jgi:hypothetical protein
VWDGAAYFAKVLLQQGRTQLDADAKEAAAIAAYRHRRLLCGSALL